MRKRKQDWLGEGRFVLGQDGVTGLTIDGLAKKLGLTKGSFYHHFKNGQDYQQELVAFWAQQYVTTSTDLPDGPDRCLALLLLVPGCGCRTRSLTARDDRCESRLSAVRVCDCRDEAEVAREGLCLALFSRGWAGSRRVLSLVVDCAVRLTFLSSLARSAFCLPSGLLFRGTGVVRFLVPLADKSLRLMTSFRSEPRPVRGGGWV